MESQTVEETTSV